jgi:CRISPR/Cas system-associated exonuclease Cas4 (RecB family)
MLKEIFDLEYQPHQSSGKFSISSVGSCLRTKYLELKGLYKKKYDQKTVRTFAIGDAFHRLAMKTFFEKAEQADISVVATEINIPECEDSKYFSGRTDCIISHRKTGELNVVDFKSCSGYALNKVRQGDVAQNYKDQVNLYLHFFKIKKGYLLFISKDKGEIEEVEVNYDEARAKQVIKEIEEFFLNYVDKNIEPAKCTDAAYGCECCGYGKNSQ